MEDLAVAKLLLENCIKLSGHKNGHVNNLCHNVIEYFFAC